MSRKERKRAYMREYRAGKGKDKILAARAARREMVDAIKSVPCEMCGGIFPPYCMDFHHRDPSEKTMNIGQNAAVVGLDRLLQEIEKCDILCANCHRITEHGT